MNKIYFTLLCALPLLNSYSQQGLEGIIVEKYYEASNDDLEIFGVPKGSTTYRIFVDLHNDFRFQAAYGNAAHPLTISTTTTFYNDVDNGDFIANTIARRHLGKKAVMLDSWLSVGAAGEKYYGILKSADDTLETVKHANGLFDSKSKEISLIEKDGLLSSDDIPRPTFFGIDSAVTVFKNKVGSEFKTSNGTWAFLGKGSVGADSLTSNNVLIAQITTDGELNFELNIQVGSSKTGEIQKYVARNPTGKEIFMPQLIYSSKSKKSKCNKRKK
jgi:hypothetical protein